MISLKRYLTREFMNQKTGITERSMEKTEGLKRQRTE